MRSKFPTCRPGCRPYLFKSISNLSVLQFQPRISYIHMQGVTLPSRNYHDAITINFPHFPIGSSEIVDLRVNYHREKHIIFSKLSKEKSLQVNFLIVLSTFHCQSKHVFFAGSGNFPFSSHKKTMDQTNYIPYYINAINSCYTIKSDKHPIKSH